MQIVPTEFDLVARVEAHVVPSAQTREAEAGLRQLSIEELRAVVGGPIIQNQNG